MTEQGNWKPDIEEAIKNIIKATYRTSGAPRPDEIPHLVRSQLSDHVSGRTDLDQYIKDTLQKMKEAGEI
ncbi:MAG: hypothetical protein MRY59_06625 [Aquisalinus sp.]|nr:hypothetical protein [Aquisalinus sp.]